jgi:hypothetical protein
MANRELLSQSRKLRGHGNRISGQRAQQHPEKKHAVNRGTEEAGTGANCVKTGGFFEVSY